MIFSTLNSYLKGARDKWIGYSDRFLKNFLFGGGNGKVVFFCFQNRVSPCSPDCPRGYSVDQTDLELRSTCLHSLGKDKALDKLLLNK